MGPTTLTPTQCSGCGIDATEEEINPPELFCPDCGDCFDCCEENHENDFPGPFLGRCFNGNRDAWREAKAAA